MKFQLSGWQLAYVVNFVRTSCTAFLDRAANISHKKPVEDTFFMIVSMRKTESSIWDKNRKKSDMGEKCAVSALTRQKPHSWQYTMRSQLSGWQLGHVNCEHFYCVRKKCAAFHVDNMRILLKKNRFLDCVNVENRSIYLRHESTKNRT